MTNEELDRIIKREREFKKAMQQAYLQAQEREKDRERHWRMTKQGAFESSMLSLDALIAQADRPDKISWLSDNGRGVRHMLDELDGVNEYMTSRAIRLKLARKRLKRHNPKLLDVFDLIVKNGTNRKESIFSILKNSAKQQKQRKE